MLSCRRLMTARHETSMSVSAEYGPTAWLVLYLVFVPHRLLVHVQFNGAFAVKEPECSSVVFALEHCYCLMCQSQSADAAILAC